MAHKHEKFFKNEGEIREFFGSNVFQFQFRTDGILYYKSINPIAVGGDYNFYEVNLVDDDMEVLYGYSTLSGNEGWLEKFKIEDVRRLCSSTNNLTEMYNEIK